ncbi:MAG TPA: molybdenum cofactor guanylyltransferase [Anaerolineae bacterium]|nr:molybdenum cofactor guanylyltransferase [Anaerolineae bacterium]HMR64034.1 molybdenum cofactor guanylyltransferase [Anaerolineae bacterium]
MISVAVLAGGQSKRMGQDKAFLKVGGQPVIERVLERVTPLTDDLFISTNSPEKYARFGLRLVSDVYPDKAALGGIYSAIHAAQYDHVLIVACDMPFLNPQLLRHLITLAPTAEVVAPLISPPQPETMHAVYSKACLAAIKPRLLANQLRIIGFFEDVSVRYVEQAEVARFDPHFYTFLNMNTPADWERVKQLAADLV